MYSCINLVQNAKPKYIDPKELNYSQFKNRNV